MANAMRPLCVMFPSCNHKNIVAASVVARPVMVMAVPHICVKFPSCSQESLVATPMVTTPKDKLGQIASHWPFGEIGRHGGHVSMLIKIKNSGRENARER